MANHVKGLQLAYLSILLLGVFLFVAQTVTAQNFPERPIRIVTGSVGGGNDRLSRAIAEGLTKNVGWNVIVENRGGTLPMDIVAQAIPDGHTIIVGGGSFVTGPVLEKLPVNALDHFAAITMATRSPDILVVHPSLPVNSVKELIALLKANPGKYNYAATSPFGGPRVAAELFKTMAGVSVVGINHKNASDSYRSLLTGTTHLMFASPDALTGQIQSGKLKALAVTSATRSELAPNLPTVASALPGFEMTSFNSVAAPKGTPERIIRRLNAEIVRVLMSPGIKNHFLSEGVEVVGSSPSELTAAIKSRVAGLRKLVQETGGLGLETNK